MGPPVHNLLEPDSETGESIAPKDIYSHMHYYTDGNEPADSESMAAIHRARHDAPLHRRPATEPIHLPHSGVDLPGHSEESDEHMEMRRKKRAAGEHGVTIYRAAPKGVKQIGAGDWVTLSPSYATDHAKHPTDSHKDMPVYKAKVPAKHVRWAGDSLSEFGYSGPPVRAYVHKRGGHGAEGI